MRFRAGRNVLEAEGAAPFFSQARAGSKWTVAVEGDGRAHVYDGQRRPLAVMEGWQEVAGVCGGRTLVVRASAKAGFDSVTLFGWAEGRAVEASEGLELAGQVTALWPAEGGAVAIVRAAGAAERYAAYHLAVDCSR